MLLTQVRRANDLLDWYSPLSQQFCPSCWTSHVLATVLSSDEAESNEEKLITVEDAASSHQRAPVQSLVLVGKTTLLPSHLYSRREHNSANYPQLPSDVEIQSR